MKSCSSERIGVRQYNKSELPRLRWTPELHRYFVQTVEILGGRNQATPKRILQMMGVKGLKISHIKSHLQMYRSMKLEQGSSSRFEDVVLKQATKQTRGTTLHSSDIKIFLSSVSSSSGTLREEEEFNRSKREHKSSSIMKDSIISQQDSDSCLQSRMSEEMLDDQEEACDCELSLSLKPTRSPMTQQLCGQDVSSSSNSTSPQIYQFNFVQLKQFPLPPHLTNLDLTI
ncbi:putative Myb family transcription factor At1g14600 [Cucurbita moschata]|uniref:Myb family transcription factor At1g14600 n=1 Tax=Cucurbita moschata TaxID=3662 RepID=A0A6J1FFE3_CUCMO|nr:putative Myb family transcription factor At1g14600 [Cucurbita moschata]